MVMETKSEQQRNPFDLIAPATFLRLAATQGGHEFVRGKT
jgi:hypothetical protein